MSKQVLVVGSIGLDDVKTPAAEHFNLLGGSASFAAVAASFFAPVHLVGVVGHDFPQDHRNLFARRGIHLEGLEVAEGRTFRWSGEYEVNLNNRRTRSIDLGVFEKFEPKLPAAYRDTPYILLANIAPVLQARVLDQLTAPKFVIADTMDLWINNAKPDLLKLLKRVDMLILNDSEARELTGEDNLIKAGAAIRALGPKVVAVKKGEHGALLFGENEFFTTGAYPLAGVVDPTGAGDCFAGGVIGTCAQRDDASFASLRHAVVNGTLLASFNVESFSLRRLETLDETQIAGRKEVFTQFSRVE